MWLYHLFFQFSSVVPMYFAVVIFFHKYIYIVIIIFIKSRWQCELPWISPTIHLNHLSFPVGRLNYILHLHRADVCESYWSANTGTSMCRGPLKNVNYEFVLVSLAVSCMSYSTYMDDFFRWEVRDIRSNKRKWFYTKKR